MSKSLVSNDVNRLKLIEQGLNRTLFACCTQGINPSRVRQHVLTTKVALSLTYLKQSLLPAHSRRSNAFWIQMLLFLLRRLLLY